MWIVLGDALLFVPFIVIAVLLVTWKKCETFIDDEKLNPANEFKILLATDIHLGHKYDNIIRSNDTFDTFDEIFEIAKKEKVDFVLLGGDLFDVNEPNLGIMNQAIAILSKASLQTRFLIGWQDSALIWLTVGAIEFENPSKHVHGLNPPAFELISDAAASFGYTPSCIRKVLRQYRARMRGFNLREFKTKKVILKFQIGSLIG